MGDGWERSEIPRDGSEMAVMFLEVGTSTWSCDKPLEFSWAWGQQGRADALVLSRLLEDPFKARAPWLFQVVAACQPHPFPTCGSDLKMSRSQNL